MTSFTSGSLHDFLEALASAAPTPGGGTAAAIAGAMGASLLVMVTGLAKTRTGAGAEVEALGAARGVVGPVRDRLCRLADEDAGAFDAVMAAYRLPKLTEDEKRARTAAIQQALRGATVVPLETLRACASALDQAVTVAAHGNRSAASDVGVAVGLLEAAAAGAAANVRINLDSVKDETFKVATAADTDRLLAGAAARAAEARARLRE